MAALGVTPLLHFTIITVVFLALLRPATAPLIADEAQPETEEKSSSVFQLPPRILWPLGAVAFCSSVGEGSMADWSAVYLKDVVSTSAGVAAFGYAAFSLTMTVGRLLGDRLATRLDVVKQVWCFGELKGAEQTLNANPDDHELLLRQKADESGAQSKHFC